MADGRRLREGLRGVRASFVADAHESETLLITSDYALWMAHPSGQTAASVGNDAPSYSAEIGPPSADRIFG
jgi:hypothetical protein